MIVAGTVNSYYARPPVLLLNSQSSISPGMDHIPTPPVPFNYPVKVPFLAYYNVDLAYDGLGFQGFPGRKGFHISEFAKGDFGRWTYLEAVTLYQSWCFFGLLAAVFKTIDDIKPETFLHDDFVTTSALPRLFYEWERLERLLNAKERMSHQQRLIEIIQLTSSSCSELSFFDERPFFYQNVSRTCGCTLDTHICKNCPVSEADIVFLSVILVGDSLQRILDLYDGGSDYYWGETDFLKRRLLRAGWCRQEISHLFDQGYSISSLFYFSTMERHSLGFEHQLCNSLRCSREVLNYKTYRTVHSATCSNESRCQHVNFEPRWDRHISRVVQEKLTPVPTLKWNNKYQKLDINIQATQRSIARRKEQLLTRFLRRFPTRVLRRPPARIVPGDGDMTQGANPLLYVCISHVWSDGMGNMKGNSLPICQLLRLQKLVNALYPDSELSIPFWIDTVCVPRKYPERGIAIAAMRDIYKNADKVLVLDSVLLQATADIGPTEMLMRLRSSTWVKRLWTYHETGLANRLYYQFGPRAATSAEIWTRHRRNRVAQIQQDLKKRQEQDECSKWNVSLYNQPDADELKMHNRLDNLDLPYYDGIAFISELEGFKDRPEVEDHVRLVDVTRPLRWRWTSRLKDEPICFAGFLGRNVDDLIDLSAVQRMQRLFQTLNNVPADILFVSRPSLQNDGCRWMPASFLGGGQRSTIVSKQKAIPEPSGLRVNLPGIILPFGDNVADTDGWDEKSIVFVDINGTLSAIINTADSVFMWSKYSNQIVGIVLEERLNNNSFIRGVLVTLLRNIDSVQYCRFEYLIEVMAGDAVMKVQAEKLTQIYSARFLESHEWCIG